VNKRLVAYIGVAVAILAVVMAVGLYLTRGTHIRLEGSIQKVRTLSVEDNSSILFVDFRFVNPAEYEFLVKEVEVHIVTADGNTHTGTNVAEIDARRLFEYYPAILGQKFNDTLVAKERILAHQSLDRMIAARFEVPQAELDARKQLIIRVQDVDGAFSEIRENDGQ